MPAGSVEASAEALPAPPAPSAMWPFLSRALFPPPTEAWLRRASSDPEAQGWGAWSQAEKSPLGPGAGDTEEEETGEAEEREEDAGFLLSVLERGDLAECPLADQVTAAPAPAPSAWWRPAGISGTWGMLCMGAGGRTAAALTPGVRGPRGPLSPRLEEGVGTPTCARAGRGRVASPA